MDRYFQVALTNMPSSLWINPSDPKNLNLNYTTAPFTFNKDGIVVSAGNFYWAPGCNKYETDSY